MKAECEIDIPSIVCDHFGDKLTKVNLIEAACKSASNFNLFSIGRCLVNGWKLSGDSNHVLISKNGVEIKFDIKIRTKKGVLYC